MGKWFEAIVITPRRSTTKSARFIEIVPRYRNRVTKGAILILKARFTPFGDASNVPEPATPKPGPCPQAASSAPGPSSEQQAFGTPRRGHSATLRMTSYPLEARAAGQTLNCGKCSGVAAESVPRLLCGPPTPGESPSAVSQLRAAERGWRVGTAQGSR